MFAVCRRQGEPHAQIPRCVDGIGDGTVKSDRSVLVLLSFRTRSYRRIPSSCLRRFWWKASRVLTSADSKVQVSAAYNNTDKTSVWYIRSLVSGVRRLPSADLIVPATRRTTMGDRAFAVAAPRAWNSLPDAIRRSLSLAVFKRSLKTHFYIHSFY